MVNVKTAMIHKDDGLAIRTSQRGDLDVDELTALFVAFAKAIGYMPTNIADGLERAAEDLRDEIRVCGKREVGKDEMHGDSNPRA